MKKVILGILAVMPFATDFLQGESSNAFPNEELKMEWLGKIKQANAKILTADVTFDIYRDDGIINSWCNILFDANGRRTTTTRIFHPKEKPSKQLVLKMKREKKKSTIVEYHEKRNADFSFSNTDIEGGRVAIRQLDGEQFMSNLFFVFDDVTRSGDRLLDLLKMLPAQKVESMFSSIEFNKKKCLKFSGIGEFIFEKERGIVLEKSLTESLENGKEFVHTKYEYSDHRLIENFWFPMTVRITYFPRSPKLTPTKMIYRIKPESVKLNHKIFDEQFATQIPQGFKVEDEIQRLTYLATGFTTERENIIKKQLDEIFTQSEK